MRGTGVEIEVVRGEDECWETREDSRRPLPCSGNRKPLPRACWRELRLRLRGNRDVKKQPQSVREAEAEMDFQATVRAHTSGKK